MTQITLAEKIRYLRKSRNMSQVELARRLGLTNNAFISHLEHGTKRPSDTLLCKIAEVFAYDVASLRALAAPPAPDPRQSELEPAPGADLLARIRREAGFFGERISEIVAEAIPAFIWSREQRIIVESTSGEVWIIAPVLPGHGAADDLTQVAVRNLHRGARYRYLTADTKEARIEAGRLLRRYQGGTAGESGGHGSRSRLLTAGPRAQTRQHLAGTRGRAVHSSSAVAVETENMPEIGFVPPASFPVVFECALFDPLDAERTRGSMVPPDGRGEWEIALTREQALDLGRHFARWWERFAG